MTREEVARKILQIVRDAQPPPTWEEFQKKFYPSKCSLTGDRSKPMLRLRPGARPRKRAAALRAMGFDVEKMNTEYALIFVGSRAMIVKVGEDGPFEDQLRFLTIEAFRVSLLNTCTEIAAPYGGSRLVTHAQAWLKDPCRRQYDGIEFYPNPDGASGAKGYLNLWQGFAVAASEEGSWAIFRDHLLNNVCDSNEATFNWVLGWFAHMVQRPRERPGTALVLRGGMGVGKSIVGEVIGALVRGHHFQVGSARYITSHFNLHQAKCLLLQADEAVWAGDKEGEGALKNLVTSENLMIEAKGVDPIRMANRVRLLMTSNEDWVAPAGLGERRFCVLDVNGRCARNYDYFGDMIRELESGGYGRLLRDLQHVDLSKVNVREIPRTAALLEQQIRTLDPLESWWLERLTEGVPTRQHEKWPERVPTDALYRDYLKAAEEIGATRRRDPATFGSQMGKIAPGIERRRDPGPRDRKRDHCYALPGLAACRSAFETMVGTPISWPEAGQSSPDETTEGGDDSDAIGF